MRAFKILLFIIFTSFFLMTCSEDIMNTNKNNIPYRNNFIPGTTIKITNKYEWASHPLCYSQNFIIYTNSKNFKIFKLFNEELSSPFFDPKRYFNSYAFTTDISDDGYLLFDIATGPQTYETYYIGFDDKEPKFLLYGDTPSIYGNLYGKYNIAYCKDESIYITDIYNSEPIFVDGPGCNGAPNWSNDGRYLVYTKHDNVLNSDILIINNIINKTKIDLYKSNYIAWPRFSPDDKWISFEMPSPKTNVNVIWLISINGGDPKQLVEYPYEPYLDQDGVWTHDWTPDGKWIIYDIDGYELWKVRVFE